MRLSARMIDLFPRLFLLIIGLISAAALAGCGSDSMGAFSSAEDDGTYYDGAGGSSYTGGTTGTAGTAGTGAVGGTGGYATGGTGGTAEATGGTGGTIEEPPPEVTWIQLSTDDSTSMASPQMYKAGFASRALKSHEFVNYYDPPSDLFDAEAWALHDEIGDNVELALKGQRLTETCDPPCEGSDVAELLFQMRADRIAKSTRRNWNTFLCVDVSGSMWGDKIAFVREALDTMLIHFKTGDRLTLITFDSSSHDVFIDLEFAANETDIRAAFAALAPGSSTNMIAGLDRTYDLAQENFDETMLQRVILFSDGNANVGDTDIASFAGLTRINGQEGIYLSGVGVGSDYDWDRMDQLTDAGKGAHVFLPDSHEVDLIFGDYFHKIMEVAADNIAIEMTLPAGITLESFSGEEVSTNPEERLQNIVLAAGDDMTFVARFVIEDPAALNEPTTLRVTVRPLSTGIDIVINHEVSSFSELFAEPGRLFERTRVVNAFGKWASGQSSATRAELQSAVNSYGLTDWGMIEIDTLLGQ